MSRGIEQRIDWFLAHNPSAVGMCLNHTWQATDLPSVGCDDANAAVDYVKRNGELRGGGDPPRGAWVLWRSSTFGHAALSLGDKRIASTDVNGQPVGKVSIDYPSTHWGHSYAGWCDWYGERFTVGDKGGDDVPLTDDEIERIARKVWAFQIPEEGDSKEEKPAKVYLRQTWNRAGRAAQQEADQ